jgi:uncharacterized protein (DUF1800 family)
MGTARSEVFWINHLLRRAGFGATPHELSYYCGLGYDGALDELLNPQKVDNGKLEDAIRQQDFDFTTIDDLKRWWLYRMAFTRRPLEEKMTLFWHGHFATSNRKVNNAYAMYGQNQLFRANGLGNFSQLLHSVSKDPAMIVWLDNQQNRKGKPNENYAREIMELFTLGIGNYSESDIKEAARAFTGWQTLPAGFFFNKNQHDDGEKTVLGVTGNLNGDDVVDILVKQPATGKFIARKMVKFFVADEPDEAMVGRVADVYRRSAGDLKQMMRAIFTDKVFLSEKAFHAKIKSPAELVVGAIKTLQITKLDADLPTTMARMGQDLFMPPNVKGWDGGRAWIATDTMMERFNFANRITSEKFAEMRKYYQKPSDIMLTQGLASAGDAVDYFLRLLVDDDAPPSTREKLVAYVSSDIKGNPVDTIQDEETLAAKLRGLVHLIMTLPTYQLA